jgi:hypothetical protein
VLTSPELTRVYDRMEHADELVSAGDVEQAIAVFSEARVELEAALGQLDLVEEAVGARSEAEAGLEAWRALAASADLEELELAVAGAEVLARARELLASGDFPNDKLIEPGDTPLCDILAAIEGLGSGDNGGKVMIVPCLEADP